MCLFEGPALPRPNFFQNLTGECSPPAIGNHTAIPTQTRFVDDHLIAVRTLRVFLRHAHFPAGITTSLYPSRIHPWSEASVLEHGNPTKASESAASKFQGQLIQKLYYMLFPVLQAYAQPLPFKRYGMQ